MRVIFMGTPDFAVPSLEALIRNNFEVVMVVTQPDRPAGRGQQLKAPPVKELALKHDIPVLQPESLRKDPELTKKILETPCDFLVVAAFGQILSKEILAAPKIAPLNVHASLLPKYRGAAPIARSIIEEETETGITIQWMVEALDMGDVLFQIPCRIEEGDNVESLHDRLKVIGASALISTLKLFGENAVRRTPQDPRIGSYAPKITKKECELQFDRNGFAVHRQIMGLSPWPGAECRIRGERVKIYKSAFVPRTPHGVPGTVIDISNEGIIVACREACVALLELQLENRKRLRFEEFVRGFPIPTGLVIGGAAVHEF